ncbi:MAG: NifU family protein [Candidatus Aenigmatarchaeota archaeon]
MDKTKEKIISVLKEDVAKELEQDGGGIELIDFKDGTAYVRFKGACMGCPMASITLGNVVETILRQKVKEVKAVRLA